MDKSFVSSSDNIIIEFLQRVNDEVTIRFVECHGLKELLNTKKYVGEPEQFKDMLNLN